MPSKPPMTADQLSAAGAKWFKASYSGAEQACVEVADLTATQHASIAVRDSKAPNGPVLLITPLQFRSFVSGVQQGL
ncbi:DUF397 domain-containing protein [Streptomyces sp. NPDC101455]|uniref:DUF397 domain-containing protein n=1 Tax=Streptomyces sp. NPDC101455 TaxID=3366142 RepID=UPI003804BD2D